MGFLALNCRGTAVASRAGTHAIESERQIPTALALEAGTESNRPLALAVVGGLTSSTLLSLFLVPVMFLFFAREGATSDDEDDTDTPVAATHGVQYAPGAGVTLETP